MGSTWNPRTALGPQKGPYMWDSVVFGPYVQHWPLGLLVGGVVRCLHRFGVQVGILVQRVFLHNGASCALVCQLLLDSKVKSTRGFSHDFW